MLEIRNITKVYRSKTGDEVRALDNVSITFPESGMVFILGKSGSGKSTLLNVMGGLDSYDSGEFVIMGKSSKDFAGSDFDAYRNTFIGFIFQEYNVLDDFTVGANIGLALELQGKKATDEKINEILAQMDLVDYAKRKPNELSGGQKQRVAIARALVKDPQIIMADEPTGALDSNTGKQIFDALKVLSREKLILVVSHDRDFAERYADRIIEMQDGQVISDVSKHEHESVQISEGIDRINDHILRIKGGYHLTAADLKMINEYLGQNEGDILLSGDGRVNSELRSAVGISDTGSTSVFETTDVKKDYEVKSYEGEKTKFIRSRLPMKNAIRMGGSSLKHKKFRLVMTILLSLVAFAMFGLADTMAAYNKVTAATESIMDSKIKTAALTLGVRQTYYYGESENDMHTYYNSDTFNDADMERLKELTGMTFIPVFNGSSNYNNKTQFSQNFISSSNMTEAYNGALSGFISMTDANISEFGFNWMTSNSRLPQNQGEIVITDWMLAQFKVFGFKNSELDEQVTTETLQGTPDALIGKHLALNIGNNPSRSYTIVGILDTKFDFDRYKDFIPSDNNNNNNAGGNGGQQEEGGIGDMMLMEELSSTLSYSFHTLCVLNDSDLQALKSNVVIYNNNAQIGTYMQGMSGKLSYIDDPTIFYNLNSVAKASALDQLSVQWVDNRANNTLGEKEIVVPFSVLDRLGNERMPMTTVSRATVEAALGITVPAMSSTALRNAVLDQAASSVNYRLVGGTMSYDDFHRTRLELIADMQLAAERLWTNSAFLQALQSQMGLDISRNWNSYTDQQNWEYCRGRYQNYLYNLGNMGGEQNTFGDFTVGGIRFDSYKLAAEKSSTTISALLGKFTLSLVKVTYNEFGGQETPYATYSDWNIVGFYESTSGSGSIISDTLYNIYRDYAFAENYSVQDNAYHKSGVYAFCLAPMPTDRAGVEKLVQLSYQDGVDIRFSLQNQVMTSLDMFNQFVEPGAKIFLFVGIGFAVFSALLLMNFIATSISYKKREIGILRAVGARSSDVFKIFFSESFIIAMINYVLALAAAITTVFFLNRWMRGEGINVTLLSFGARQALLMLGISIAVALLASFLPVYKIARRKPVDAIKDR